MSERQPMEASSLGRDELSRLREQVRILREALEIHSCGCGEECFEGKRKGLKVPIRTCIHWKAKQALMVTKDAP